MNSLSFWFIFRHCQVTSREISNIWRSVKPSRRWRWLLIGQVGRPEFWRGAVRWAAGPQFHICWHDIEPQGQGHLSPVWRAARRQNGQRTQTVRGQTTADASGETITGFAWVGSNFCCSLNVKFLIFYLKITDTSIAELIKEITMMDSFQEALEIEQDLLHGLDTDKVSPYIEDFICKQEPLVKILRLICLQSSSNSGLKPRVLEHYKREIIHAYGFQVFFKNWSTDRWFI